MDVIIRDKNFFKKDVVRNPEFKCSTGLYGASTNDFELIAKSGEKISIGDFVSHGNSEMGGCVLDRITDTAEKTVKYIGRTFRGQLENSIVTHTGTWNIRGTSADMVRSIISNSRVNYSVEPSGNTTTRSVTIPLGANALQAIDLVLSACGEKMLITVDNDGVHIQLKRIDTMNFDASQVDVVVDENKLMPTALHARNDDGVAVSVYIQSDGSVGSSRYYNGFNAVEIYQEVSAENSSEMRSIASDKLIAIRKSMNASEINVKIEQADVGDTVNATVQEHGIKATQTVCNKKLEITNKAELITFETGG